MQARAIPITTLFDVGNKAYVIPGYQRPFAWGGDKALELLDSILEASDKERALTSLGAFLFLYLPDPHISKRFGDGSANTIAPGTMVDVVDGQQRLTVLALLGAVLNEEQALRGTQGSAYQPSFGLDQFFSTVRTRQSAPVPVLVRSEDHFDRGLVSELSRTLNSFNSNSGIATRATSANATQLSKTLVAIRKWVKDKLKDRSFERFCEYLFKKCQCVEVIAVDEDDAFRMFESLNSTGAPLTAFEVFRSKASQATPPPSFVQTEALLNYDYSPREGVTTISNTLVLTLAQAYSGVRPRKAFVPLKQYLDSQLNPDFFARIELAAQFFSSVWVNQTSTATWLDPETTDCIRYLKAANHDLPQSLLLRYFLTNPENLPRVTKIVVAFFSLWRVCFPTNALPEIYRALLNGNSPDSMCLCPGPMLTSSLKAPADLAAYFRLQLEKKLGSPRGMMTLEDLWISKIKDFNYESLKTVCRLYVLIDISSSLKPNLTLNDPWTALDDIEHIHPVSGAPRPNGLHSLGNLTLLPPTVNKSIQAMPWGDKRQLYEILASPQRYASSAAATTSGVRVPAAVESYLVSAGSIALAHLGELARNQTWDDQQIELRTTKVLRNSWNTLYAEWLK